MRRGDAEHSDDGVTDELLDAASDALDVVACHLEVAGQHPADVLGVSRLRSGGEPHEVAEQHRDDLAFLNDGKAGSGERRAAFAAEFVGLEVLVTASRAGDHPPTLFAPTTPFPTKPKHPLPPFLRTTRSPLLVEQTMHSCCGNPRVESAGSGRRTSNENVEGRQVGSVWVRSSSGCPQHEHGICCTSAGERVVLRKWVRRVGRVSGQQASSPNPLPPEATGSPPSAQSLLFKVLSAMFTGALLALIIFKLIPELAGYASIGDALKAMSALQLLLLLVGGFVIMGLNAEAMRTPIHGLTFRRAFVAQQSCTAVSNVIPGPSGTAARFAILYSWKVSVEDFTRATFAVSVWSNATMISMPGIAFLILAITEGSTYDGFNLYLAAAIALARHGHRCRGGGRAAPQRRVHPLVGSLHANLRQPAPTAISTSARSPTSRRRRSNYANAPSRLFAIAVAT